MARRAKPHDEELPFVALMDTMTNVVGVLIIVLVMIGIGLAKSVQKVLSDLPKVSEEEHAKLKKEVSEFDAKRDPAEVQAETDKLLAELAKIAEKYKELESQKETSPVPLEDLDALGKQLEVAKKEQTTRKLTVDQLLTMIDQLNLKLDKTPKFEAPPPVVVRLPNARPMPDKAQIHRVLVSENKLVCLRIQDFSKVLEDEFNKDGNGYTLRKEAVKGPDGKPVMKKSASGTQVPQRKMFFDLAKMEAHFNDLFNKRKPRIGDINRDVLVQVTQVPNSPNIQFKLAPRPEGGETIQQATSQNSTFRTLLKELKKDPRSVIWFHVCKDSIPAYLAARDIIDNTEQVPVGWEMFDKPLYSMNMPQDYAVDFVPVQPAGTAPGTPAAKPAGPPPIVIAAPKTTVD
jgi:hypothetical protein